MFNNKLGEKKETKYLHKWNQTKAVNKFSIRSHPEYSQEY